jgi:hypothetical protein
MHFTGGCLHKAQWDRLHKFSELTRTRLVFGLNAKRGRMHNKTGGVWDSRNARALIQYTKDQKYSMFAYELGNELSLEPKLHAEGFLELKNIIDDVYGSKTTVSMYVCIVT